MALSQPQMISRMMLDRIGQNFDDEAHFSGDEARTIAAAITALEAEVEGVREALDLTAGTLRNLFDRYIHNDSVGAEVWADLETDRVLAMAARHLRASIESKP